ncbi:MAG: hypothetical protein E7338_00690 [Clostridiales bacterium]|nr:hypothetical protein [Clostridiales bacterium]
MEEQRQRIPVFFVDGFLDSGKTSFIIDTIKNDSKDYNVRSLLLCCEQGEVEYEEQFLKDTLTTVKYFESQDEFDYRKISEYIKESNPDRVIVELNGMWDLTKIQLPRILQVVQFMTLFDAQTFPEYFNNMRQMVVDMIKRSSVACFTKSTSDDFIKPYESALKLASSKCMYMIADKDFQGHPAFEEAMPYDWEGDTITLKDDDYPPFYIDTFEHKERYEGKVLDFDCVAVKSKILAKNQFIAGRFIMNCCANDIQLYGFLVDGDLGLKIKDRATMHVKAKIEYVWSDEYKEEELVLKPIELIEVRGKDLSKVLDLTGN